ncbi:MAG: electron transfer flavoprotein subunit alpha/FixB family protein [Bdellovibrionales bacterium]|nr:electron transfer flavoprotein subunit alpha/FixB family protein [Bdellovibrionales bacterium]
MSQVFVFCEFSNGKLKKGSTELLSAAKTAGKKITALVIGPGAKDIASQTGEYGASTCFVCDDEKLKSYHPLAFAQIASQTIKDSGCNIFLATASMMAKDLFPRVAAQLETGIASDCTDLSFSGDDLIIKKPLYAGKCKAQVQFNNSPVKMVLMRPNQLPVNTPVAGASVEMKILSTPDFDSRMTVKEVSVGNSDKVDLTEANIIVSGGRGMKEAQNFDLLNQLADTLGATVGASRAVADAGWVPHSMQVGQTGKTVAPSLYIACGISGAIQHLAGMSGSKVIVAINTDKDAPIFSKATYGVVGDLFDVVPKLTEEFKAALN